MTRIVLVFALVFSAAAADQVRMVREGLVLPDQPGPLLITNVIQLLESTTYQSTSYAVKSNIWETLLASDSYVYAKLDPPRNLLLFAPPLDDIQDRGKRESVLITEILVPLPETEYPRHIFARTGTNVVAHTKYSAIALKKLILEPALKLRDHKVYKPFADLPELDPQEQLRVLNPPPLE